VVWGVSMLERLHEIKVPTLIFSGEEDTPDNREIVKLYQTNYRLTTCKLRIIYKESRNTGKDYS